jgi:hypothetical protein
MITLDEYISLGFSSPLDSVVLFKDHHSAIAFHSDNKPDILLEINRRSELLMKLIQLCENKGKKFSIYVSNSMSLKRELDFDLVLHKDDDGADLSSDEGGDRVGVEEDSNKLETFKDSLSQGSSPTSPSTDNLGYQDLCDKM